MAARNIGLAGIFCFASILFAQTSALSQDGPECAAALQHLRSRMPGQILSVTVRQDQCRVIYLMHRDGQRPKRLVFDFEANGSAFVNLIEKRSGAGQIRPVRE
jgi:hypothetical protein